MASAPAGQRGPGRKSRSQVEVSSLHDLEEDRNALLGLISSGMEGLDGTCASGIRSFACSTQENFRPVGWL